MEYAPGLSVEWTDKELAKIEEIKSRENRIAQKRLCVPEHADLVEKDWEQWRKERKREAIRLLCDNGFGNRETARFFNTNESTIRYIIKGKK